MYRSRGLTLFVALVLALAANAAPAELVIFANGGYLAVDSYEVKGDRAKLELSSGGVLRVPLLRIERIVDDEVVAASEAEVVPSPVAATVELGFTEGQATPSTPYGELIFEAARRHGVNPDLVAAMVRAESAFDRYAVSIKGARGLMQLMPATAQRFGVPKKQLFDPKANLEAGLSYLAWLRRRFDDDLPAVLAAYNAGEANVDRYGGVPPFRETRGYISRIYRFLGVEPATTAR